MKRILFFLLLLPLGSHAADSANQLKLYQRDGTNAKWVEVNITPTANALFGFNGSLLPGAVTIGDGLALASGVLSATGDGAGDVVAANNLSELASAATARTNLGATTAGSSVFTLTNPAAVTFLRFNADNTATALSAADFRTAISLVPGTDVEAKNPTQTDLAGGTELTVGVDYFDDFAADRTLTITGTATEGSHISLTANVTAVTVLTIPECSRLGASSTTTTITMAPGNHFMRLDRADSKWWLADSTAPLYNLAATAAPTVNDDSGDGYAVGSLWIDVTNDLVYQCVDATATAAVWRKLSLISGTDFEPARTAVSQADAEAGTSTTVGGWTPERVKQAIDALAAGSGAETGDIKFIADGASVPSGWSLTGVNGIAELTTPDADYKAVMRVAGTIATPTFSPAAGEVADGATITFSSTTPGVTFRHTTSGTDPTRSSGTTGSSAVLSGATTYEVIAYRDDVPWIDSAVASAAYTIPAGATYLVEQGFEGTGFDNGETWTERVTPDPEPDYTLTVLAGSHSLWFTGTAYAWTSFSGQTTVEAYCLFRMEVLPDGNANAVSLYDSGGVTLLAGIQVGASGVVKLAHNGTVSDASATALVIDQTYHVWIKYVSGGQCELAISTTGTKPTADGSGDVFRIGTGASSTAAELWCYGGATTGEFVVDHVLVDDATIGSNP